MDPDPDDIIRVINLESGKDCAAEIKRLIRSRRGFKALIQNIITSVKDL